MKLIDADKLPYSNIKTNEYGYVETTKTVVLEEDIANAQTVQAIPLDKVKQARKEMNDLDYLINDAKYSDLETRVCNVDILVNEFYEIMDKLIAESEGKE